MSTETLGGSKPVVVINDRHEGALYKSFVNDSAVTLVVGQEVTLKANGTIDVRDAGTDKPLGIVYKGGVVGDKVVVLVHGHAIVTGVVTPTADAGAHLKPTGVVSSGKPVYVAAVAGDYVSAMLLEQTTGASQTKRILVVSPFKLEA